MCVCSLICCVCVPPQGVVFDDDERSGRPVTPAVPRFVHKYTAFLADMCGQEYQFVGLSPSLLAAALVLAARRAALITYVRA